ncbi:hypothetical protein Acsp04_16030 [Actinomadura sp. NBRC 104425]|uniref:hypothetical protein n=1 Tax=Actinomadura sp. NBRC 104425 TaxID=3032204 RepID=UPI0024A050A4|nr:hypothetical protein [Actinomadura sp. NBRC 104425]GLZ11368.1 hypothetical protein Acsp04_16030 [Actinomadura sp. NBRC 104425]
MRRFVHNAVVVAALGALAVAYGWLVSRGVELDGTVTKVVVSKDERSIEVHAQMSSGLYCAIGAAETRDRVTVHTRCYRGWNPYADEGGGVGVLKVTETVKLQSPLGGRSIRTGDGRAVEVERLGAPGGS